MKIWFANHSKINHRKKNKIAKIALRTRGSFLNIINEPQKYRNKSKIYQQKMKRMSSLSFTELQKGGGQRPPVKDKDDRIVQYS